MGMETADVGVDSPRVAGDWFENERDAFQRRCESIGCEREGSLKIVGKKAPEG
jgi:hypothetical protein